MTTPDGAPQESTSQPSDAQRPLARLLEVQRHDTVIDQLRHRRATLPERAALAQVDGQLSALDARVKELSVIRDEHGARQASLEEHIEASKARRATLEKRLFGGQVAAARDLQAMNEEVRHLARHISELEDREIEVMELLEPVDAELSTIDERRTQLDADASGLRGTIGAAETSIDGEIEAEAGARGTEAAAVEADLLARYEALRRKLGGTGAAPLVGGSCGGCHLALPAMELDRIRRAPPDAVITCDQCGRILVR